MNNVYWMLALLLAVSLGFILFAFRQHNKIALMICSYLVVASSLMYWQWGEYRSITRLFEKKHRQQQTAEAMKEVKNIAEVVARMERHLAEKPDSAQGWYLLGRLYVHDRQLNKARQAFEKAYDLDKQDLKISLQYMEILYLTNGQQLEGKVKALLSSILTKYPNQLDALNFAASDAYTHKRYAQASEYWQKMLPALSEDERAKAAILKAIAKAQKIQKAS